MREPAPAPVAPPPRTDLGLPAGGYTDAQSLASGNPLLSGHGFVDDWHWTQNFERASASPKRIAPPPGTTDLARNRPTDQSSISPDSRAPTTQADSAGAVAGTLTGSYAFHTAVDETPWWQVSLPPRSVIVEIRIHNRLENQTVCARGTRFAIDLMDADGVWAEAFAKSDTLLFGGADGAPFRWKPDRPLQADSMRIRLLDQTCLHYDAVEVFGVAAPVTDAAEPGVIAAP